jgi:hypothetical protein
MSTPRIKSRFYGPYLNTGVTRDVIDKTDGTGTERVTEYLGGISTHGSYQVTSSVSHPGPPYKEGGPFSSFKVEFRRQPVNANCSGTVYTGSGHELEYHYSGSNPLVLTNTNKCPDGLPLIVTREYLQDALENFSWPSADLASTYGPKALQKFAPHLAGTDFLRTLLELKIDGIPNITKVRNIKDGLFEFLKDSSKNYLSYEFGIRPLIDDLRKLYETTQGLDSRLRQLVRDNGQPIRRRGELELVNERTDISYYAGGNTNLGNIGIQGGHYWDDNPYIPGSDVRGYKTTYERVWFSGRYRYYIPFTPTSLWDPRLVAILFGVSPDPKLLYDLVPWTFLIDWFTDLGSLISNLTFGLDPEIVHDYAFLMRHSITEWHYTYGAFGQGYLPFWGANSGYYQPGLTVENYVRYESKERIAASPFGFGVGINELSARQYAILIALGLSRNNFVD